MPAQTLSENKEKTHTVSLQTLFLFLILNLILLSTYRPQAATLAFAVLQPSSSIAEPTGEQRNIINIGPILRSTNENWSQDCFVSGTIIVTPQPQFLEQNTKTQSHNKTFSAVEGQEGEDYDVAEFIDFELSTTPERRDVEVTSFRDVSQDIPLTVLPDFETEENETLFIEIQNVNAFCEDEGNETTIDVIEDISITDRAQLTITDTFNEAIVEPEEPIEPELPEEPETQDTSIPISQQSIEAQLHDMSNLTLHSAVSRLRRLSSQISNARNDPQKINTRNLNVRIDGKTIPMSAWNKVSQTDIKGAGAGDSLTSGEKWGVFANGTIDIGEQNTNATQSDYDSSLILMGLDYQISDTFLLGAALGQTSLDAEHGNRIASTVLDRTSFSLFSSHYGENYYIDAILGLGRNEYDLNRSVNADRLTANTQGEELSFALGAGYQLYARSVSFNIFSQINYIDVSLQSYQEISTGSESLANVDTFSAQSLLSSFGAEISWAINTSFAVISPQASLAFEHQFKNTPTTINGVFIGGSTPKDFEYDNPTTDTNYILTQVGVSAVFKHGISSYITYDTYINRDDLSSNVFSLGLRWPF